MAHCHVKSIHSEPSPSQLKTSKCWWNGASSSTLWRARACRSCIAFDWCARSFCLAGREKCCPIRACESASSPWPCHALLRRSAPTPRLSLVACCPSRATARSRERASSSCEIFSCTISTRTRSCGALWRLQRPISSAREWRNRGKETSVRSSRWFRLGILATAILQYLMTKVTISFHLFGSTDIFLDLENIFTKLEN